MDIKNILSFLIYYYSATRGVGHTYTMLNGAGNTFSIIVCASNVSENSLKRNSNISNLTVNLSNLDSILGLNKPLAFDNYALQVIFWESNKRIQQLEREVSSLKSKIDSIKKIVNV